MTPPSYWNNDRIGSEALSRMSNSEQSYSFGKDWNRCVPTHGSPQFVPENDRHSQSGAPGVGGLLLGRRWLSHDAHVALYWLRQLGIHVIRNGHNIGQK